MSRAEHTSRAAGVRVWVVAAAGHALGELLGQMDAGRALEEGRVFVEGRRIVDPALVLDAGQRVEVHPARRRHGQVELLGERDGFVVALKPPELPTEPDHHGLDCLRKRVAKLSGIPEGQLHAVSRLDVGVSGVVLLAATPRARRHAQSLRSRGALKRRYVGISERLPAPRAGRWDEPIGAGRRGRGRRTGGARALPAETRYTVVGEAAQGFHSVGAGARELSPALLALEPQTGRTHQIRVHAASAGVPLLGDRLYGGALVVVRADGQVLEASRIALHAARIELPDLAGRLWSVAAPDPEDLLALWADLGGHAESWHIVGDQRPGLMPSLE